VLYVKLYVHLLVDKLKCSSNFVYTVMEVLNSWSEISTGCHFTEVRITMLWHFHFFQVCLATKWTYKAVISIYKPTNAHIISHKTLLKHFKTLRHVSILSDHHQGPLFLAKIILQYSQFNSYLQTRCCGSISCCVGMCCGAAGLVYVVRCTPSHCSTTQHDMLPQHLVCKYELNCEYRNIT